MQGQCSVGQGLPPLHEARCGWVFLTVASNLEAAPGLPQRQHGADNSGKLLIGRGSAPKPAGELPVLPDPLAAEEGFLTHHQEPHPALDLWKFNLGFQSFGFASRMKNPGYALDNDTPSLSEL